jgi:hypothetical protein
MRLKLNIEEKRKEMKNRSFESSLICFLVAIVALSGVSRGNAGVTGNWNPEADIDGDARISSTDLVLLRQAYGASCCPVKSPNWDTRADVDNDRVISLHDLYLLAQAFNSDILPVSSQDPEPWPGYWNTHADLDNDRDVDGVDFGLFATSMGSTCCGPGWNPEADLDGDGDIDMDDSNILVYAMGWVADP